MARESLKQKASRIAATEGAIRIILAGEKTSLAMVIGDTDSYIVRIKPGFQHCTCPAVVNPCAHILAVQKIWTPAEPGLMEWVKAQIESLDKVLA